MNAILNQYGQKSFSREEIKQQRKKDTLENIQVSILFQTIKMLKSIFTAKQEKVDKENIIAVLEKLIEDLKEDKIKNFTDFS